MSNLKEMEEFFNEFLRKYESGEIPKEEWETQPPAELHLFRRRRMVPVPPNLLQEFWKASRLYPQRQRPRRHGSCLLPLKGEQRSAERYDLNITFHLRPENTRPT